MGIDSDFGRAYAKAQIQAGNSLPTSGTVLVSVREEDHERVCEPILDLVHHGFEVLATPGTARVLETVGVEVTTIPKVGCGGEGERDTVQRLEAGEIDLVINTVGNDPVAVRDSVSLRRTAVLRAVPYFTTLAGAGAGVGAIRALQLESIGVRTLQEIHGE
jgi:carbamoyl-phosphate synthase large subunit